MPKVLRILNRFNLGGPTYNAAYLTKYLYPDFETKLIGGLKDPSEASSEYMLKNLDIDYTIIPEMQRSINPFKDMIAFRKIKEIIKDYKPDIVHTHASKAGSIGRKAAIACNIPVIIHTFHGHVFHSYFSNFKAEIIKNIERKLAQKTNKIVAISDIQKKELVEIYKIAPSNKVEVIPLGFDLDKFTTDTENKRISFRKKYMLANHEVAIGIVGRIVPIKNHKLFLDGFKYVLNNSKQKVKGFIIGDGECKEEIIRYANSLGIKYATDSETDCQLNFTSWIKDIDIAYAGLDIVAMTSFNEGTPVSLIEAQAAEKAIITTDTGGIKNVILPNKTALLVDNNDTKSFSNKLLELTNNEELRKTLSCNGNKYVCNTFNYKRLVNDTKQLYFNLLQ